VGTAFPHLFALVTLLECSGVRRKFSWGVVHSVAYGGHCIWCVLFVTSQFDVIFMFPNYFVNCQRSELGYRRNIHSTLRHSSS